MPAPFVSDVGSNYFNRLILRDPTAPTGDWYLRTFSNSFTPTVSSPVSAFTESLWTGYSALLLDPTLWLPPVMFTFGSTSYYRNAPQIWTPASGSHNVYGWYVTRGTTDFLWGQAFDAVQVASPSSPLVLQLVFCGQSVYRPL